MKIAHVSTAKSWRGGEQQIAYLCQALKKAGIEQVVVCRKNSEMQAFCEKEAIPCKGFSKRSALDPGFAWQLARLVKEEQVSIVHPHDSHAHSFTIMAARFFRMKAPIVLHRRVDYPVKNSKASHYKYNHPQIKRIICVSEEVKGVLSPSLQHPERATVIHSGVDLHKFEGESDILRQQYALPQRDLLIGNVAAITQQKDYFTFVRTAERILQEHRNLQFFVIGEGDQKEKIKALVAEKKLEEHFHFTGFRPDIERVLPALDLLLFPSEKEGLGTTIIDAFAAGTPVVATRVGGIPELIEHEQNGLLAPLRDDESLAKECLRLIEDPALREQLASKGRETAQRFSKERMAEQVIALYRELTSA